MINSTTIFEFYLIFSVAWWIAFSENKTELVLEQSTNETNNTAKLRMVTDCLTYQNDTGFCMQLSKCPQLSKQAGNKKSEKLLEASKCGPKNDNTTNYLVCCQKEANTKPDKNPLPQKCGQQNVTIKGRILGGKEASIGEFPWLARLIHKDKAGTPTFGCTGFLIAQKFVLTAAHCLQSDNIQFLGPISEVHLGEHNIATEIDCNSKNKTCADKIQIIKVRKNIVHHSYSHTAKHHHNDIGLIYLRKGAKFSSYVSPICLSEKRFEAFEYWLSGWGTTEKGAESPIKLKVSVPPYSQKSCSTKYKRINMKIINKQLCAGGKKNKDSCSGDSGGPLMYVRNGSHWFAAGVVSYGLGCGREDWPAIYTNISAYIDWIKTNIIKELKKDKTKSRHLKH